MSLKILSSLIFLLLIAKIEAQDINSSDNGYLASLDLLYWKAHEKGAVLTNKTSPVFTTTDYTKAPVKHPHFDWDPGFRLGIGHLFSCIPCQSSLEWTHYQTNTHQHQTTNSNDLTNVNNQQGMFPIWALSKDIIAGDYVSDAKMRWKIDLNLLDLTLAQTFFCYEQLKIRPFVGIRGAWINQEAHIHYSGGIFLADILAGGINRNGTDHIRLKNNFWGIGPRIGLEARWNLCHGISIFGNGAISGLGGSFDIKQKETFVEAKRFSHHKHLARLRWISDLAVGIAWKTCVCNYNLAFQLSWEYHVFFDQLELKRDAFHLISSNRNLSTQGITLSGIVSF